MDIKQKLISLIDKNAVKYNAEQITPSFIWNCSLGELADLILNIPEIKEALERKVMTEDELKDKLDEIYKAWDGEGLWHRVIAHALAGHIPAKEEPKPADEGIEPKQERVEELLKTIAQHSINNCDVIDVLIKCIKNLETRITELERRWR